MLSSAVEVGGNEGASNLFGLSFWCSHQAYESRLTYNIQFNSIQTALANYTGADEAMSDGENSITSNDSEDARKKQKQTHTKIFDLPGVTNQRADSPQLLQDAVDTFLDGSTDILSPTEEERASMYD